MRTLMLFAAVLLAGCAHLTGSRPAGSALTVSDDGRRATAGGERWTAPEGATFYQRGSILHVVSSGQLHPHDDHYHLTHRLENEDWQALYRARAEDSPLPPIRRQVAATVLALLLDERIPGTTPEATDVALRRMSSIIGKARRAVEGNVGARAIEAIITYDFEIRDDGRTLDVGAQRFKSTDDVRFGYCASHFHVEDAGGKWAQPVEFPAASNGAFAWPPSIFFEVRSDGTVAERPASTRWRRLSEGGQIRFTRDHWHVTEAYAHPRLQLILKSIENPKLAEPLRNKARGLALDLMRLRLDTGSDAEFEARLESIDQVIERAGAEFEKEARGKAGGRR